jgi:hypothetical protein
MTGRLAVLLLVLPPEESVIFAFRLIQLIIGDDHSSAILNK